MKNVELTVIQRIIAIFIYLITFLFLCYFLNENSWGFIANANNKYNLLFISGALLLIFGAYLTEPYFTKPVDIITNATAVILALLSINDTDSFVGYGFLLTTAYLLLGISVLVIFLHKLKLFNRLQYFFYSIITIIGQSKVAFSAIYLATIFSYFNNEPIEFSFLLTFWVVFITGFIVENIIVKLSYVVTHNKVSTDALGQAIGCENPFTYKVEMDFFIHGLSRTEKGKLVYLSLDKNNGALGIIVNEKQLINKKWLTVYMLEEDGCLLNVNFKTNNISSDAKTIFSYNNYLYSFDVNSLEGDERSKVEENYLYKNRDNFVGYVTKGSDINKVFFHSLIDSSNINYSNIKEGAVLNVQIHNKKALFQIIDGKTTEEQLENHDVYGHTTGVARKLGRYNLASQELETAEWLPNIYSPIFLDKTVVENKSSLSIGVLPTTNLEIVIKEPDSLITHNTAILGILGIGKSCLTFELIQKALAETDTKIICIDITNEYKKELPFYIDENLIQDELPALCITGLKNGNVTGTYGDPSTWGNVPLYKNTLSEEITAFAGNNDKRVLVLNPDWHSVSKAGSNFNITHKLDLTVAEKTRIISERLFVHAKDEWEALADDEKEKNKAKYLIVFEEAHSLVPEWNSASNAGDQNASNGTAKVILQGRKYGLGSFVITQRTANISKSILNQCNTIFALRIFDDTGKQFLENYIGSDYANVLPTLEERYAIVVGKAMKLKQPVILKLNERDNITKGDGGIKK